MSERVKKRRNGLLEAPVEHLWHVSGSKVAPGGPTMELLLLLGALFGVILQTFSLPKRMQKSASILRRFWISFWSDFGAIFGSIFDVFVEMN